MGIIQSDLASLTNTEWQRISLGVKPSGPLHIGTAMTLLHGVLAVKEGNSRLHADVMDLDFDFKRGSDFIPYFHEEDPNGCHDFMKNHTYAEIDGTLQDFAHYFGADPTHISVGYFSETTRKRAWKEMMNELFLTPGGNNLLRLTVKPESSGSVSQLLAPVCDNCNHSSTKPISMDSDGTISAACYNEKCSLRNYTTHLNDFARVNVFYLVDPIRDLIPDEEGIPADLHIFGGDYNQAYGMDRRSKVERIGQLMQGLRDKIPSFYVGPVITNSGHKLGKSLGNGCTLQALRDKHADWEGRLYDLLKESDGLPEIDVLKAKKYLD